MNPETRSSSPCRRIPGSAGVPPAGEGPLPGNAGVRERDAPTQVHARCLVPAMPGWEAGIREIQMRLLWGGGRRFPLTPWIRSCNRNFAAFSTVRASDRGDAMGIFGLGGNCRAAASMLDVTRGSVHNRVQELGGTAPARAAPVDGCAGARVSGGQPSRSDRPNGSGHAPRAEERRGGPKPHRAPDRRSPPPGPPEGVVSCSSSSSSASARCS